MELVENEIAIELLDEEQAYVRDNYIDAAVERMTYEGKIWGYPTEHQAPALIYRRSVFEDAGIQQLPQTTVEVRELARELTREEGGVKYYGFTQWYDNYPANFHFPGIIWRHGGELVTFEGDVPVKVSVDTPEAIAALSWWRGMVDDGSTQVGEMPFVDAWQNGLAIMGEIEPWFPFINLRDAGVEDIYEDLGVVHVRSVPGVDPVVQSGGWELIGDRNTAHHAEQVTFMRWMMHKPDMPFSRFIVERVGSLPAPLDYPTPIPGWSEAMVEGYANQTAPITRMTPTMKILGSGEINRAITETVEAVMLQQKDVEPALLELQTQVDEILQRTDGHRLA
jgi:multiple sugar transport system substrate-binding protein